MAVPWWPRTPRAAGTPRLAKDSASYPPGRAHPAVSASSAVQSLLPSCELRPADAISAALR